MNVKDLESLLKGKMVVIKDNDEITGAIMIDFESNQFLALEYMGKTPLGEDDFMSGNIYDTLEEALAEIEKYNI